MAYILTFILGLVALCVLFAIPYLIGTALGILGGQEDLTTAGRLVIGLLTIFIASVGLMAAYCLGALILDF